MIVARQNLVKKFLGEKSQEPFLRFINLLNWIEGENTLEGQKDLTKPQMAL